MAEPAPVTLDAAVVVNRDGFSLDAGIRIGDGEVVALLGPNGAGKTTLLTALAGLVALDDGVVLLDDVVVEDPVRGVRLPAAARSVGVVFQDGRLFPHLTALENVAFGLRARGAPRTDALTRARSWLDRVGVGGVADRKPAALSGGEAQRVALARALAPSPRLVLLDEPLSSVDAGVRTALRREIGRQLGDDLQGPQLLVTHDPVDAMVLATRLVILEDGSVVQEGSPADVRRRPRSRFAADLVGVNLFRGRASGGLVQLDGGGRLVAADAPAGDVFSVIHPHAVALHRHEPEGTPRNAWRSRVVNVEVVADRARVQVEGAVPLVAEVTLAAVDELRLTDGGEVWATVKATEVTVYDA